MSSRDTTVRKGGPDRTTVLAPAHAHPGPRWARPTVAADYIGTTSDVLAKWRHLDKGPSYIVPPGIRSVLYDLNEVDRWLTAGRVETLDSARIAPADSSGRAA